MVPCYIFLSAREMYYQVILPPSIAHALIKSAKERESEREQEKKEKQSIAHGSKSNIRSRVNYIQDFHLNNKSNNSTDTTQSIP